jgi:MFS family permease
MRTRTRDEVEGGGGTSWSDLLAGRWRLTVGLLLLECMNGLQLSVAATTMPQILAELGGLGLYGLVFAGYTLPGLVSIPISARLADRGGSRRPIGWALFWFSLGTVAASMAPTMWALVLARVLQGYGGSAFYALSYGLVATKYPSAARPRLIAVVLTVGTTAGLVGPAFGAVVTSIAGWRWAFAGVLPVAAIAATLLLPVLGRASEPDSESETMGSHGLVWPLVMAAGSAVALGGLSMLPRQMGFVVLLTGLSTLGVSVVRVLPAGSVTMRSGLGASVGLGFWLAFGLMTANVFTPLLLTRVAHRSVSEAGVVVMISSVSSALGSWWQTRAIRRVPLSALVTGGAVASLLGCVALASILLGAPWGIAHVSWVAIGSGAGVAHSSVLVSSMDGGDGRDRISRVAARFVSSRLGIILGTAAGSASLAWTEAAGASLRVGLAGTFSLVLMAYMVAATFGRRVGRRIG